MRILITGGAGFIGSHLADALIEAGHSVRALDALVPQVHGSADRPSYLHPAVDLVVGDIRDPDAVRDSLDGIDAVFHFAALVGVGQSMYQMSAYTAVNVYGTAVLLEALAARPVEKLIVASSMSVYGEARFDIAAAKPRAMREVRYCDHPSVYALTKYDQENLCLIAGQAYGIPTTALRFFNVYGPRQALSNPYTGVIAIFASRLLNNRPPLIYEDGRQSRDFVSVYDVVRACKLALDSPQTGVFNIGSGTPSTVLEVACALADALAKPIAPQLTGTKRAGDIRHCFADISRARTILGYRPAVTLDAGLADLAGWLRGQTPIDSVDAAARELVARGLVS